MRFDDVPAVDVQWHPEPAAECHKDNFQVDVIAKDEPKTKDGLEQNDQDHAHFPRNEESSDICENSNSKKDRSNGE